MPVNKGNLQELVQSRVKETLNKGQYTETSTICCRVEMEEKERIKSILKKNGFTLAQGCKTGLYQLIARLEKMQ